MAFDQAGLADEDAAAGPGIHPWRVGVLVVLPWYFVFFHRAPVAQHGWTPLHWRLRWITCVNILKALLDKEGPPPSSRRTECEERSSCSCLLLVTCLLCQHGV